jgi:uncharacterized protein YceH (UPF0502 family)
MSDLEAEVMALRRQLDELAERVRLDAVADAFIRGAHEIREGDNFLLHGGFPTKLTNISSDGKWTFFNGAHTIEPFRTPTDCERLYTIAEVAEIVAKLERSETGERGR